MPSTGLLAGDAGLAAVIVQGLTNFLKLNVLDKFIDPTSQLYDWVTRGMVFILTLLVNAAAYIAEGGTPSGAWAIIVAGLASTGLSVGNFHLSSFVRAQRATNIATGNTAATTVPTPPVITPPQALNKPVVSPVTPVGEPITTVPTSISATPVDTTSAIQSNPVIDPPILAPNPVIPTPVDPISVPPIEGTK